MVQDPWSTARWIRSPEDWERFHTLAGRIRDELIITPAEREIWESWRIRQRPDAWPGQAGATWKRG